MYYLLFILLLLALFMCIFFHHRKKKCICEVRCMDKCRKCSLLEELAYPFGYCYHCSAGFFSSTLDAWQKKTGYTWLYDHMAPRLQMVFDALPVYFNYDGKTWLIEFWKGQYGINTGAEIGIYHADKIIPEEAYKTTLFECADEDEMLNCSFRLCKGNRFVRVSGVHWWLTAFLPGCFSNPSELCMKASLSFPNREMLCAFADGLLQAGCSPSDFTIQELTLTLTFTGSAGEKPNWATRFWMRFSQWKNKIFCRLYLWVTRPFQCTEDRILYLYYYLPIAFRKLLRLRRCGKRL